MRIVLFNVVKSRIRYISSGKLPPLGLAYIASILERNGYEVKIIDLPTLKINDSQLKYLICHEDADLFGLSSMLFGLREVAVLAKIIKVYKPNSIVVLGGLCTVYPPVKILRHIPQVDIIVKGEGEYAMLEICSVLEGKRDLNEVKSIFFRKDNEILSTPQREWINNLDAIPLPARHLLPNDYYRPPLPYGLYFPATSIETSRGCVSNCSFCLYPSRTYRCRSINSIANEVEMVVKTYAVKEIYFVDNIFTINENRTLELCDEILSRKIKVAWSCKERVDKLSAKILKKMKKAGCYIIAYGVESGSQSILNNLNKNITTRQIEETFSLTRKAGIRSVAYLMVGSPGEDENTIQNTINFIDKIDPDFVVYAGLMPDPASSLYQNAINEGILKEDAYENYLFSNKETDWPLYETPMFPKKKINKWVFLAYKKFYFRPRYWIYRILEIKNINDISNMLRGLSILILDMVLSRRNVVNKKYF